MVSVHRIFKVNGVEYVWVNVSTCCGASRILFEVRPSGFYNIEMSVMVDRFTRTKLQTAIKEYHEQQANQ
jgi:hypothetical protein